MTIYYWIRRRSPPYHFWRGGLLSADGGSRANYIRSGAPMPINCKERRNTIWADSTSFSRARVMSLSSVLDDITRQFS